VKTVFHFTPAVLVFSNVVLDFMLRFLLINALLNAEGPQRQWRCFM